MTLGNQSCSQLPAGQTRKRGLLPRSGGMSSPLRPGSSLFLLAEVVAAPLLSRGAAISTDSGDQTGQDSVFVCFDICFFMLHS